MNIILAVKTIRVIERMGSYVFKLIELNLETQKT